MKYTFPLGFLIIVFIISLNISCQESDYYIRLNTAGYLPGDFKPGIVISESKQDLKKFNIVNQNSWDTVYSGDFINTDYEYDKFSYCYTFYFSDFNRAGKYKVEINGKKSTPFVISDNIYSQVVDSLMLFLKAQRCGPTDPLLHAICHLSDATSIVGSEDTNSVDVTGGWHDAGDYIKFFSTTAATTYMLLFSYEFDKEKFGFDNNDNTVPDIIEEAKIGLDWLLRCNYSDSLFVIQVQDEKDHLVGWRLPENDSLQFDRPAYVGIGKNLIGIYSAVMATASRIWNEDLIYPEFAERCLESSIQKYSIHKQVKDIENGKSLFYNDKNYLGKLALGAIELYYSTGEKKYLKDAIVYGDSAGSDFWWSWGDINSLADYRISRIIPRFIQYIADNLSVFNTVKDQSVFNEGTAFTWGTTTTFLGAALQAILYKSETGLSKYDSLLFYQRDYVLGRNPWGVSFICSVGSSCPKYVHSQVAYFNGDYLPGALTSGPATTEILYQFGIRYGDGEDDYFNSDDVKYFDDRNNYITNEPTIFGNSTAIFVMGYFSDRN